MTREDKIRTFVQEVRFWLADQAEEIEELEDNGEEGGEAWLLIMLYVEEAGWVLRVMYDNTFFIIDENDNAKFNFMWDWTDAMIDSFISDWKTRWGVGQSAAVSTVLTSVHILDGGTTGSGNLSLPPGGATGDHLIKTTSGLGWETPETLHDMGEQ